MALDILVVDDEADIRMLVADILEELMAALDTDTLTELNGRMAVDREKPEDVARDFLESEGLL